MRDRDCPHRRAGRPGRDRGARIINLEVGEGMTTAGSQTVSRPGPTAQELAQAIRLGLEHRRWPFAPVEPPVPEPPAGIEVVPKLWPNYNTLQIRADARPGRFQKPMRLVRRVFKALLRPWLDVQTQFNHSVIETLDAHQRQLTEHL